MINRILRAFWPGVAGSPLWAVSRRYAWAVPVVALLSFLATTLEGLGIGLLIPLMGTLLATQPTEPTGLLATTIRLAGTTDPNTRLVVFGVVILGFVVLKSLIQAINTMFIAWVDGRAGNDIRSALSLQLFNVGFPFFLDEGRARLLNILSTEAWRVSDALRTRFKILVDAISALVFTVLLLIINWKLTLIVVAGAVVIRTIQVNFVRRVQTMSDEVSLSNVHLAERMVRTIDAIRAIHVFNQEEQEHRNLAVASEGVRRSLFEIERLSAIAWSMLEVALAVLFIGLLIGAHLAGTSFPILFAFMVVLYRFQPLIRGLSGANIALAATEGSVREVEWLLDPSGKPAPPRGALSFSRLSGPIVFDRVSFTYGSAGKAPALHQLSFTLERGRTTALIGRSGSGKSTVVALLCRLIEPDEGRILIDGVPLNELDPRSWRAHLGLAGQDVDLIDGTIRENIEYGEPGAALDAIVEAARMADIHEFIDDLPDGYQTRVGTRGLGLSGGQRQRVGLARAFLRRPDILILDEATNAIDGLSEAAILSLVRDSGWQPTTIVVSHHASTLAFCDDGVVIDRGTLVESGPLLELAASRNMSFAAELNGVRQPTSRQAQ
ncbi:ABC transporter ATP-binding protein [Bradyrhizobium jicamae]|uniref:ABC transporter ATP-binding protein n=1 Tax=Bradyrhizobium jicamae TaxID=280332 RepID=UPI001BABE979|nr:ABC transporter ATP-binding protein [Bradyrhizobium jicamae]MBR0934947.1 ABC transporter ATP-binding protein [Bradyrhizobium jicamae]